MERRRFIVSLGTAGAGLGVGRGVYNVALGYDENLVSQDLAAVADEGFGVRDSDGATADDLADLRDGAYGFEFHELDAFFERLDGAQTRPATVEAVRGDFGDVPRKTVEGYADETPTRPDAYLAALDDSFQDTTSYDVPRYIAGAVTDNVLRRRADLRQYFEDDVSYDSLTDEDRARLFCYEYTYRAAEGLHTADAHKQEPPVVAAVVRDRRHKHVYLGVASVVREADAEPSLRVPMTFADYKYTVLRDDLLLGGVGDGLNAYNSLHRADEIDWSRNS